MDVLRLILKPIERADLDWILNNRNDPQKYVNFNQPMPISQEQQLGWYENEVLTKKTFAYIVYLNKMKIGYAALQNINWIVKSAEVSHFIISDINPELAAYAHELILVMGFDNLGLNRIHSVCFEFNPIFEKLKRFGFKLEGTLRQSCFKSGRLWDSYMIAVLKDEWKSLTKLEGKVGKDKDISPGL